MRTLVEMCGGVLPDGLVTAADVSANSAKPQMKPFHSKFEALLTSERSRSDVSDTSCVRAAGHFRKPPFDELVIEQASGTRWTPGCRLLDLDFFERPQLLLLR